MTIFCYCPLHLSAIRRKVQYLFDIHWSKEKHDFPSTLLMLYKLLWILIILLLLTCPVWGLVKSENFPLAHWASKIYFYLPSKIFHLPRIISKSQASDGRKKQSNHFFSELQMLHVQLNNVPQSWYQAVLKYINFSFQHFFCLTILQMFYCNLYTISPMCL